MAVRDIVPGGVVAQFPKDAVQDGALINGRPSTTGRRRGGRRDERLEAGAIDRR